MRTLLIPDIHNNIDAVDLIIKKENADNIVFLGDYFDNFGDGVESAIHVAEWLKKSMRESNRIHLLGNHDNSYRNIGYMCSGFTPLKKFAIDKVGVNLNDLKHFTMVDDWLCTHAGLTKKFYKHYALKKEKPVEMLERFVSDKMLRETLYGASQLRGGYDIPGILWCDSREFEPIPKLKQIFGHTPADEVRILNNNYCLDTALHHYAIYSNVTKKLIIKTVSH